jgi:transcriptional regulator with XRE-family HTH domain
MRPTLVQQSAGGLAYLLGGAVRDLREAKGWSQTQLAREAGMTQPAVARLEAGGTIPTLPVLQRLARALDADLTITVTPHTDVA